MTTQIDDGITIPPVPENAKGRIPFFTKWRLIRLVLSVLFCIGSISLFMLSSMAGPHQLDYLKYTIFCDIALVILATV